MPKRRNRHCNLCGRSSDEVGTMSRTGLCPDCGVVLLVENAEGIRLKTGPAHRRRLRGYEKWINRQLEEIA